MRFGLRNTQKRKVKGVYSLATPDKRIKDGTRDNKDQTRGVSLGNGTYIARFLLGEQPLER
jgi:hypothetical protein